MPGLKSEGGNSVTLFFSPFADIDHHINLEKLVLSEFKQATSSDVRMVVCDGVLRSWCTCFSALGFTARTSGVERMLACMSCKHASKNRQMQGVEYLELSDFLRSDDYLEWNRHAKLLNSSTWRDFAVEGVSLGRFAAYETILQFKKSDFSDPQVWSRYLAELKSCFLAYKAAVRINEEVSPTAVACHSFQYGVNRSFLEPFRKAEVPSFHFVNDGQIDSRAFSALFLKASEEEFVETVGNLSPHVMEKMTSTGLRVVLRQIQDWMDSRSPWTFSLPRSRKRAKDVREILNIDKERKCILVLTSSPDELLALEECGFTNIEDENSSIDGVFLHSVLELARMSPQLTWIVRLHPRLYGGVRTDQRSPWLDEMFELLLGAPSNVVVNSSDDELSLYDVALITDVVVNQRSTSGLEMALLGFPVAHIHGEKMRSYPADVGFDLDLRNLEIALDQLIGLFEIDDQDIFQRQLRAAGWIHLRYHKVVHRFVEAPARLQNTSSTAVSSGGPNEVKLKLSTRVKRRLVRRSSIVRGSIHLVNRWRRQSMYIDDNLRVQRGGGNVTPEEFFEMKLALSLASTVDNFDYEVDDETVLRRIGELVERNIGPWDGFEGRISQADA
jgi:hypothetical protein